MSFRNYGGIFAYSEEIHWTSDRQPGGLELNSHPTVTRLIWFSVVASLNSKDRNHIFLRASACSDS